MCWKCWSCLLSNGMSAESRETNNRESQHDMYDIYSTLGSLGPYSEFGVLQVHGIPDADLVCFVRKNGGKTWRAERHPSPLGTNERNRIGHRCNVIIASVYVIWSYAYRVLVPVCHTPSIDELPGRPTVIQYYHTVVVLVYSG